MQSRNEFYLVFDHNRCRGVTVHVHKLKAHRVFHELPSHVFFDLYWLQFLLGQKAFPWRRVQYITPQELFPHLSLPHAKVFCFLKSRHYFWGVEVHCTCPNPFNLFCLSLRALAIAHWSKQIRRRITLEIMVDPYPSLPVYDFLNLTNAWGLYVPSGSQHNPITCLHFLLCHRHVKFHYAVGRIEGGYSLHIEPVSYHWRIDACLRCLRDTMRRLPFRLEIHCFPYRYVPPIRV
uniref:ORF7 protein n=1 Tax=Psittacine aviadenovirus B TaxID=2169709 RepID=A0AB38ZP94_9ADEN